MQIYKFIDKNIRIFGFVFLFIFNFHFSVSQEAFTAKKGVINYKLPAFNSDDTYALSGEWAFYFDEFISPEQITGNIPVDYINVPNDWNKGGVSGKKYNKYSYATMSLKVVVPNPDITYALKIKTIHTAYHFYANGKLLHTSGTPSKTKEKHIPHWQPAVVFLPTGKDTIDIVIHISNFNFKDAGINKSIYFGTNHAIKSFDKRTTQLGFFILGSILIMSLYHIGLFFLRKKEKGALYFGLFGLCYIFWFIASDEYIISSLIPSISWKLVLQIQLSGFFLMIPAISSYIRWLFPDEYNKSIFKILNGTGILFFAASVFLPYNLYMYFVNPYQIYILIVGLICLYVIIRAFFSKRPGSAQLALGFILFFAAGVNDILHANHIINTAYITSIGFMLIIFSQAYYLSARFLSSFNKVEELKNELDIVNKDLEQKVEKRTKEVQAKNEELENQNIEIESQRNYVVKQNNELEIKNKEITDSIKYASKIQEAVLPYDEALREIIPNSFVFYKPKDIVSGDFYWIHKKQNKKIIVVADSTGHGVPGAFMSLLGISFLNEIVADNKTIIKPNLILNEIRNKIIKSLNQKGSVYEASDGMVMSICVIDDEANNIEIACANNTLYYIEKLDSGINLIKYKGDKMPLSIYPKMTLFTSKTLEMKNISGLYLFSDGIVDQFGGINEVNPKAKKFKHKNLQELVVNHHHLSADKQKQVIEETLTKWQGNYDQIDDMIFLGILFNNTKSK